MRIYDHCARGEGGTYSKALGEKGSIQQIGHTFESISMHLDKLDEAAHMNKRVAGFSP